MTTRTSAISKTRFEALDGLRGVAALLVILLHVEWPNHLTGVQFVRNGYLAVDLFFILSGLVIATNYVDRIRNSGEASRFISLRFFRLYPLHIAMLTAFVAMECVKVAGQSTSTIVPEHRPFTGGQSYGMLLANIFLVQGLGWARVANWNFASWSISCEFCAYVLFSLTVLTGLIRKRLFFIVGTAAALLGYAAIAITHGTLNVIFDFGIFRCLAGFFFGLLIHRCSDTLRARAEIGRYQTAIALAVIGCLSLLSGAFVFAVIPLFVMLVASLQSDFGPLARALQTRPARFLGRISFSLYMVHSIIIVGFVMIMKRLVPMSFDPAIGRVLVTINPWIGDILLVMMLAIVLAFASITYRLIEEPGRIFGRKFVFASPKTNQTLSHGRITQFGTMTGSDSPAPNQPFCLDLVSIQEDK